MIGFFFPRVSFFGTTLPLNKLHAALILMSLVSRARLTPLERLNRVCMVKISSALRLPSNVIEFIFWLKSFPLFFVWYFCGSGLKQTYVSFFTELFLKMICRLINL